MLSALGDGKEFYPRSNQVYDCFTVHHRTAQSENRPCRNAGRFLSLIVEYDSNQRFGCDLRRSPHRHYLDLNILSGHFCAPQSPCSAGLRAFFCVLPFRYDFTAGYASFLRRGKSSPFGVYRGKSVSTQQSLGAIHFRF